MDSMQPFSGSSSCNPADDCPAGYAVRPYQKVLEMGRIIMSEMDHEVLLRQISEEIKSMLDTERCSVFLFDGQRGHLWSLATADLEKNEIRIPTSSGVAGWVFENRAPVIVNDTYRDDRFFPAIDLKTGFHTRSILCVPLVNRRRECIGVLQALNKRKGDFTTHDLELFTSISDFTAIAIENSRVYEELRLLERSRERVLHHLAHELKTPLAILSGVMGCIRKKLEPGACDKLGKTLERGDRSLNRLLGLERKIEDILNRKFVEEKRCATDLISHAADLVAGIAEEGEHGKGELLMLISKQLETLFSVEEIRKEEIELPLFLNAVCDQALGRAGGRGVHIRRDFDPGARVEMDRRILGKVCGGLLKNAIENTPDEGVVRVGVNKDKDQNKITFYDQGVGITPQNQGFIFGGFFHTPDTDDYSSKASYDFNAGGTGTDLLRIKTFSERYGFDVDFESERCRFLSDDKYRCPGRISSCSFIEGPLDCANSGFSVFTLSI